MPLLASRPCSAFNAHTLGIGKYSTVHARLSLKGFNSNKPMAAMMSKP